jgi:hypothetical protein
MDGILKTKHKLNPTCSGPIPVELLNVNEVKGKAIPLQAWTGPEGSRRLGLPDFKTIGI